MKNDEIRDTRCCTFASRALHLCFDGVDLLLPTVLHRTPTVDEGKTNNGENGTL
jgi:hypothetical protein